jgi:energy-coupling factor transporter transmembrane protein EcfT
MRHLRIINIFGGKEIMELLKGLGVMDPSFLVPVIVIVLVLAIIAKVAKKILKLAILVAVIAFVATTYVNLPTFEVENGTAKLELQGKQYSISTKDVKIVTEQKDGDMQTILVSGSTRIELPFSKEFADKFIMEKLKEK